MGRAIGRGPPRPRLHAPPTPPPPGAGRLEIETRFLTFGGLLRIADVDPGFRVVQHVSPGPVVRWGGHSQGSDALAGEIGAFFGRLIVPVDYVPGRRGRLAAT